MKTNTRNTQNLGMFMRMAAEGAIQIAQSEAANFVRIPKVHYDGKGDDLVTSADLKAQANYERLVATYFPDDLLVGEEGEAAKPYNGARFTCDPVDGTKAYGRNQSTGVATMFAHADGNNIDGVCIGDVNTGEIYQFAPGHAPTRTRFGQTTPLPTEWTTPLNQKYVLLNSPADDFPKNIQHMIRAKHGGVFKDMEVTSGSIGIIVARLWKQEVAMVVLGPSYNTPWDSTPIIGMNRMLGIKHIRVDQVSGHAELFDPEAPIQVTKKGFVEIMTHETYADEIVTWLNTNKA